MELMKANSAASTMNMTKYPSNGSGLSPDGRRSAELIYARKPYSKETPRWNQSSSTWRHTSHRYSFSRDDRFRTKKYYYNDIIEP